MNDGPRPAGAGGPVLSVVLAVHDEAAYLDGCVDSALQHAGRDAEVVIVDNASSGHVPALVDELAEADDRIVARRLDEPAPLGTARAVGLDAASGDYVWCVDTTDRIEPATVPVVLDALRRTAPDVLVVDYRLGAVLPASPSPHRAVIRRLASGEASDVDAMAALLDLAPATWSLVVRASLLQHWRISPAGSRCELSFGYRALLAADRVAALGDVGYQRLRPPNAVRVPAVHGDESDLVVEIGAVLQFLDDHADALAERRRLVLSSLVAVATERLRALPSGRRRRFARLLTETVAVHPGGDDLLPPGVTATAARLVRGGHPALLRALERLRSLARPARKPRPPGGRPARRRPAASGRRRVAQVARLAEYRVARLLPLRPRLVVFAAYWYRGYSCNPRAVYEKLCELAPAYRGVWVVAPGACVPPDVLSVTAGSRAYFRLLARASYFVNNVGFPDHWRKRRGSVLVQTHHGTPLKFMGLDQRLTSEKHRRSDVARQLARWSDWDYSLSANRLSTLVWERVYPATYETLEYGYPRNDRLADAGREQVEAARRELGLPDGVRALLYAPTHREYEPAHRPLIDLAGLADALGDGWVILSRAHYFYDTGAPIPAPEHPRVVDVTRHPSIEQLCIAADVLMTDYSSVMFDYAVLDRPIVVFAPDWETYRERRGTYFDLTAEPPGVVCRTPDEVAHALVSGGYDCDLTTKARRIFRSRFCAWDDGRAAERVVRRVFLGEHPTPPGEVG